MVRELQVVSEAMDDKLRQASIRLFPRGAPLSGVAEEEEEEEVEDDDDEDEEDEDEDADGA